MKEMKAGFSAVLAAEVREFITQPVFYKHGKESEAENAENTPDS